jgi:hypothetical protein
VTYKRGRIYWFHFVFNGEHVQRSTKQGNPRVARQIEAAYKTQLAKGEVNLQDREKVPSLAGFKERFLDEIRVRRADHPETIEFYESKYSGLLRFTPLAQARLDHINEKLIAQFTAKMVRDDYERSTVNRHLATLKRALRLAARWRIINRVPNIELLAGENQREFVLSREQQRDYFDACPEFLRELGAACSRNRYATKGNPLHEVVGHLRRSDWQGPPRLRSRTRDQIKNLKAQPVSNGGSPANSAAPASSEPVRICFRDGHGPQETRLGLWRESRA